MKTNLLCVISSLLIFLTSLNAQFDTIDFEEYNNGDIIGSHLLPLKGINFPLGIRVNDCSSHPDLCLSGPNGARSGDKVAIGNYVGEFAYEPIIITFTEDQDNSIFYWKPAYNPPTEAVVRMEKWLKDGSYIYGDQTVNDDDFQHFLVGEADSIKLTSRKSDSDEWDNCVVIDDIKYIPSGAKEFVKPVVQLNPLYSDVITTDTFSVSGMASDNMALDSVVIRITRSGNIKRRYTMCDRNGVVCPLGSETFNFHTILSLNDLSNGFYTLELHAYDLSGNHNSVEKSITINIAPPPEFSTFYLELNQAVQSKLTPVSTNRFQEKYARSSVPIIPGKPLIVRYYLGTKEYYTYNYTADLLATILYNDGHTELKVIKPNIEGYSMVPVITPFPESSHTYHLLDLRSDLINTLNFLIEGEILLEAKKVTLVLSKDGGMLTERIHFNLDPPCELGISYYKVDWDINHDSVMKNINEFTIAAYPVSKVTSHYSSYIAIDQKKDDDSCDLLTEFRKALKGNYDTPVPSSTNYSYWRANLGLHKIGGGCSRRGHDADDREDRLYGKAVSCAVGKTGAHEMGHICGMIHTGNMHGECDGGSCPNPRDGNVPGTLYTGLIPSIDSYSDFGIAIKKDETTNVWNAYLFDPCPGKSGYDRNPCTASIRDTGPKPICPFDLMSYGHPAIRANFPFSTNTEQWMSVTTYVKIYNAIARRISPYKSTEGNSNEMNTPQPSKYLQVAGSMRDGNLIELEIIEKIIDVNTVNMEDDGSGTYQLVAYNQEDSVISSVNFNPDSLEGVENCCKMNFIEFIPASEKIYKIVVYDPSGEILGKKLTSPNKPSVTLVSNLDGAQLTGESFTLEWNASDADSDTLLTLVQYTPDMGKTWKTLGYFSSSRNSIPVDLSALRQTSEGVIKVSVSDGIHTATDMNHVSFCVNQDGNCQGTTVTLNEDGTLSNELIKRDLRNKLLDVFPNPVSDGSEFTVIVDLDGTSKVTLEIIDQLGRTVVKPVQDNSKKYGRITYSIPFANLSPGVYFLRTTFNNNQEITRLIIQ